MNKKEALDKLAELVRTTIQENHNGVLTYFAKAAGIPRTTMQKIVAAQGMPSTANLDKLAKAVTIPEELLKSLQLFAGQSDKRTPGQWRTGEQKSSPDQSAPEAPAPARPKKPAESIGDPEIAVLAGDLFAHLLVRGQNSVEAIVKMVITQLIMAGIIPTGETSSRTGVRFVLTKKSFRPLEASFTDAEVSDTVKLIEELRRRWALVAQMPDGPRQSAVARLGVEMTALLQGVRIARDKAPCAAADYQEKQSRVWGVLRDPMPTTAPMEEPESHNPPGETGTDEEK